jgi:flagellin
MESQVRGLNASIRNPRDAQSLVATAEGAMSEMTEILQRMRELAIQASSGVATESDRGYLDLEVDQLVSELNAISKNTKFNDQNILDGTKTFAFYQDIDLAGQNIGLGAMTMTTAALGVTGLNVNISVQNLSVGTQVQSAIGWITSAIGQVDSQRATLGALSNRLDHVVDNLTNVVMNTISAKSRIEDADFAEETTKMTRNSVLQQAATAMLSQANAQKQTILQLIQQ